MVFPDAYPSVSFHITCENKKGLVFIYLEFHWLRIYMLKEAFLLSDHQYSPSHLTIPLSPPPVSPSLAPSLSHPKTSEGEKENKKKVCFANESLENRHHKQLSPSSRSSRAQRKVKKLKTTTKNARLFVFSFSFACAL